MDETNDEGSCMVHVGMEAKCHTNLLDGDLSGTMITLLCSTGN